MLTIFTTGKPFTGHSAIIQRNALQSWKSLHPEIEVILFGDEEGAAEACAQYAIRHELDVERDELGLKRIDYYFDRAQELARHDLLCYVNCDIILTGDFWDAVKRVHVARSKFLMVGRRWDTDIREPIDFSNPNWTQDAKQRAIESDDQRDPWWIDYFVFSRGLYYKRIPPFVIGRVVWDNWLIWKALAMSTPVVDASAVVRAIHQNHDYSYHPLGKEGVWNDELARRNLKYAGGPDHRCTIADANEVLFPEGLRRNPNYYRRAVERRIVRVSRFLRFDVWNPIWFSILDFTRPLRSALGLRSRAVRTRGHGA